MNKLLGFLLRILLLLLLLNLLGIGGYLLHSRLQWTWWEVGALALACLACLIAVLAARRLYYRHREERFIRKMVEHDRPGLSPDDADVRLAELRERWRRGVNMLRHSALGRSGNALYSLPWFMVFGESGSGKSTAVSHARLSAQASNAGPLAHVTNTRNCDWWFFEKAVVLDTAGRYAVPLNEEQDLREWEEFLRLLAAHRRKEPLNGLILTLSVEQLQERDTAALADYGRCLRQRINSMTRALGADFPVYILVTKLDRVLGLTSLAHLMSREECHQALGLLHEEDGKDCPDDAMSFLERALGHVRQRLRDLSLLFVVQARENNAEAAIMPEELECLFPGIRAFARAVFAPSAYGETPRLRGLFFSSGRQEGTVHSRLLEDMATFRQCRWELPGTNDSLFLNDLFTSILPRERRLGYLVDRWFSGLSFRRHAPYMLWLIFLLTLCAYFSAAFHTRISTLREIRRMVPVALALPEDMNNRVRLLSDLADTIRVFERSAERHAWLLPGRQQTALALNDLKEGFTAGMRSGLITPDNALVSATLQQLPPERRRIALIYLCDYQSWARLVLQAAKSGRPLPQAQDALDSLGARLENVVPAGSAQLNNIFAAYAQWENPQIRDTQMAQQGLHVDAYLDLLGTDLGWITEWLNTRPSIAPVRLTDFWPRGPEKPVVPPAYTAEGYRRMEKMLGSLGEAARDAQRFAVLAQNFRQQYAREFYMAWWQLADKFSLALRANAYPEYWRRLGPAMSRPDNPYFTFINRMAEAFSLVAPLGLGTEQDTLPVRFAALLQQYEAEQTPDTLRTTLTREKEKLVAGIDEKKAMQQAQLQEQSKLLADYLKALQAVRDTTRTDSEALLMVSAGFKGGQDAASTPVSAGLQALSQLQAIMDVEAAHHPQFWRLVEGPLAWHTILAIYRSACDINALWESDVLARADNLSPEALWEQLFGEQSTLRDFVLGPCKPFLQATAGGWRASRWLGMSYPITPELLRFLDQGIDPERKAKEKYVVNVTALPLNVNELARKPHRARLRLECGEATQTLDNYNYEISADFTWEPQICGRVSLEISFDAQTFTTVWDGEWAFQSFLRDFAGGEVVLTPRDFPGQEAALKELDVEEIRVSYKFRGAAEALKAQRYTNVGLPRAAAICPARVDNAMGEDSPLIRGGLPDLTVPALLPATSRTATSQGSKRP